ncbi:MAG: nuclear transport factor 2 family protein [Acidobacteriota bacterium]
MKDDMHDFKEFMKRREDASLAFVNGNVGPLDDISTQTSPATIFGPKGDTVEDADKVNAANAEGAKMFESGSKNRFDVMQMAADNGIAYWTGIQRSVVKIKGKPEAIPMDLRVTEVFRREGEDWKLVHRHADPLKSA